VKSAYGPWPPLSLTLLTPLIPALAQSGADYFAVNITPEQFLFDYYSPDLLDSHDIESTSALESD